MYSFYGILLNMENLYLYIVILLGLLAIGDLIVGVSNDAVNFLNSAIGSKAISFRNIMIFASLGIACGALFSSGMMEVARKGIFNPDQFYFNEIIFIFMAVMLTDILLLDFFNSLGMPTSTTVSIVFELLGAAVVMALIKISEKSGNWQQLNDYINTDKATQIILGILLSVFIAFTIGALVQWVSRVILSYKFEEKSPYINAIFGAVSLASIVNFILIKGIKGTPFAGMSFEFLGDQTINGFIDSSPLLINIIGFVFWYLVSLIISNVLKWDIYKIIIGIGTFALALAFAGNDLVNFIGVPVAAFQSYTAWVDSGIAAEEFGMGILTQKVTTPTLFLLLSGVVMIVTLWFSSKAKRVVKTSLDLSNQFETKERFKPNFLSRGLVRIFIVSNDAIKKIIPKALDKRLQNSFTAVLEDKKSANRASFDKLRASINLVVAAVLISFATSLKLPLSTTYVTFMVAMGTSLADRAWGADSAVYRVAGVLNVIGGWFFTAFSAFIVCGTITYLISIGGFQVIAVIIFLILLIIGKNYINHKKKSKEVVIKEMSLRFESNSFQGVVEESGDNIRFVISKGIKIYDLLVNGLSKNKIKHLDKAKKEVIKLAQEIEDMRSGIFYFIRNLDEKSVSASKFYISLLGHLQDLAEDFEYLIKISRNHVNNNHRKLKLSQIKELDEIQKNLKVISKESVEAFTEKYSIKEFEEVLVQKSKTFELIDQKIEGQIERTRMEETSAKNTTLYFNILIRTKEMVSNKFELVGEFYDVIKKL